MIAVVLRSHLQDLALIRGLKGRIAEMQARVGRFERRAEKKRQLATSVMEQAEIRKIDPLAEAERLWQQHQGR